MRKPSTRGLLGALAVAGIVAAGSSALTASSAVPDHKLGQDVGQITGYVTSGVSYGYDTAGTTIQTATFALDSSASSVKARVTTSDATIAYVGCTPDDAQVANVWDCDVTDVAVADATGLDVFASDLPSQ